MNRIVVTNAIKVESMNGPAATVIRPTPGAHTIRCAYVGPGATLSGFRLTGGMADPADWWDWWLGTGGGALCEGDGTISNCTVEGNYATGNGGGIYGGFIVDSRVIGDSGVRP